jgi:hypothetical protein
MLHPGFLLGLFFDPEEGSDIFLRNVGRLSTDYTALYPVTEIFLTTALRNSKSYKERKKDERKNEREIKIQFLHSLHFALNRRA